MESATTQQLIIRAHNSDTLVRRLAKSANRESVQSKRPAFCEEGTWQCQQHPLLNKTPG